MHETLRWPETMSNVHRMCPIIDLSLSLSMICISVDTVFIC